MAAPLMFMAAPLMLMAAPLILMVVPALLPHTCLAYAGRYSEDARRKLR